MKCPVCKDPDLIMSERQGVEIDYCPTCRGVWLDRGELDKIIERSAGPAPEPVAGGIPRPPADPYYADQDYHYGHDRHKYEHQKHWKKKSWLQEIFD